MAESHIEIPVAKTVNQHDDRRSRIAMNRGRDWMAKGCGNRRQHRRKMQRSPAFAHFRRPAVAVSRGRGHGKQLLHMRHFNTHVFHSITASRQKPAYRDRMDVHRTRNHHAFGRTACIAMHGVRHYRLVIWAG